MTGRFQCIEVAYVRPETDAAIVVGFRPDDRSAFDFTPGQYLTLRAEIDGVMEQRCYSICSTPDRAEIEIGLKRVPGGRFSEWAHRTLKPGAPIDVLPPEGRFGIAPDPDRRARYLAIAGGSGITPVLSLAASLLAAEPKSEFTLVYGNRTLAGIMFRERLDDLKDRFLDRFSLIHILSAEAQDVPLFHGRIDGPRIGALAHAGLIVPAEMEAIFLCGPGDMAETAAAALSGLGARPAAIRRELFLPTPGAAALPAAKSKAGATGKAAVVTAIADGAARTFEMAPDDASLILAAERAGIELPSSCRGGMCCTCRARVVEGEAEMAVNYSLEPWEIEAGFVLACQSRPLTPTLTLDFDAV